jgi:hypothetical protein
MYTVKVGQPNFGLGNILPRGELAIAMGTPFKVGALTT